MPFWIITIAMTALVATLLLRALWRGHVQAVPTSTGFDINVYRDQLAEVERDIARGVVPAEDAERLRTEISRRILSADAQASKQGAVSSAPRQIVPTVLIGLILAISLGLYAQLGAPGYGDLPLKKRIAFAEEVRQNRPDQAALEANLPPFTSPDGISDQYLTLMEQLRKTVADRPDDLNGHLLLVQNEASIGNFSAAADAQNGVLRIKGDQATATDLSDYAELLVLAAGGYVSPEAELAFRTALTIDAQDGRAQYFIGLMRSQTGRPDTALRIWDNLLRRGPQDAPWIAPIQGQIMQLAQLAGVRYSMPAIGEVTDKGPTAEEIEAASELSSAERLEMIEGMVSGLAEKLREDGGSPQDWARLITSLAVLGKPQESLQAYENAERVFKDDASSMDIIRAAGSQAGVAE